jgi:hypothetical protein
VAGRTLGEAWVTISPDTAGFRAKLDKDLRKSLADFKPSVTVTVNLNADTVKLRADLDKKLRAALAGLKGDVKVGTDFDAAGLKAKLEAALKGAKSNAKVGLDTSAIAPEAAALRTQLDALTGRLNNIPVGLDEKAALATWTALMAKISRLSAGAGKIQAGADMSGALAQFAALDVAVDKLHEKMDALTAPDTSGFDAMHIAALQMNKDLAAQTAAMAKAQGAAIAMDQAFEAKNAAAMAKAQAANVKANLANAAAMAKAHDAAISMNKSIEQTSFDAPIAASALSHLQKEAASLAADIDRTLSPSGITTGKVNHDTFQDLTNLQGSLARVREEMSAVSRTGVTSADDIAKVNNLKVALGSLSKSIVANGVIVRGASGSYRGWVNTLISMARVQIPLFNGAFGKMLPHFLAFASGTHIMAEALLETVAIWVPAAIALGVFSVAAYKATKEVIGDVMNMNVAAKGTGTVFAGMSKKVGESLSQIARPYVFEAYGLGMIAMQKQSSTTGDVVKSMGGTIDRWMSEAVIAYQKSTGGMASKGASDFAILGDSFKQLGTLIEGFIKITPGYAKDLLAVGDGVLHIASALLNSPIAQAFGSIFLAVHGAFFYIGLFATLGTKLGMWLLRPLAGISMFSKALGGLGVTAGTTGGKMATTLSAITTGWQTGTGKLAATTKASASEIDAAMEAAFMSGAPEAAAEGTMSKLKTTFTTGMGAVGSAVSTGGNRIKGVFLNDVETSTDGVGSKFGALRIAASDAMTGLGGTVVTAAKGIKGALTGMLESLGLNPWLLGIAAVGAGIYFLIQDLKQGTTAAEAFGAAADKALSGASLQTFGTTVQVQMTAAKTALAGATTAYDKMYAAGEAAKKNSTPGVNAAAAYGAIQAKLLPLANSSRQYAQVVADLSSKNKTFNANASLIAKTIGGSYTDALNLANQAGITTNQMMSDQGTASKEDALQVLALAQSYSDLTDGIGGVKTAYSALNIQSSQTMKDAQSVAGAFANYTTLITGGASAFDTWAQGETELNKNISATGEISSAVTLKLGKFSDKLTVTGKGLDGTSTASIAANQAFLAQVNSSQALYGQLIQLAAASGNTAVAQAQVSQSGKDMISTLLSTAGGSKAAMVQVYALAQTFGYMGGNNLPELVKWLGKTGNQTTDLQKRMNGLTAGAGNLANAANALSGTISTQLSGAMAKSIIDAEGGQAAFDKFALSVKKFNNASSQANFNSMIKQGQALKQSFIDMAGSAKLAEAPMEAYLMQLGVKSQAQAKDMADAILGIGNASNITTKMLVGSKSQFAGWANEANISTSAANALWNKLATNNFNLLDGNIANNRTNFFKWGAQVGISKGAINGLWSELLGHEVLDVMDGKIKTNKANFFALTNQLGLTKTATQNLWDELKKAPDVTAKVKVQASVSGGMAATVSAGSGGAKSVVGQLRLLGQFATGGKIPGFHNTGDNLLATSPGGPIALQGGETIVPKNLATHPAFSAWAGNHGIPGYAAGGIVGGGLPGTSGLAKAGSNVANYRGNAMDATATFGADAGKAFNDAVYNAVIDAYGGMGGSASGRQILADAEKWKGHKYVWGGDSNPSQGWDCSSFAGYVLGHDLHMPLPGGAKWDPNSHGPVAAAYTKEPGFHQVSHNVNDIQAGDLLVENSGGHVGFGVGPNKMFSAYGTAYGTIFSDALNMTQIFRKGGASGSGSDIKSGNSFVDSMAASAEKIYVNSPGMNALFPKLGGGYSGNPNAAGPGSPGVGNIPANAAAIATYLQGSGLSKIAAAGILGNIEQESGGIPTAGSNPPGSGLIQQLGDPGGTLAQELPKIISFINSNGSISDINSHATSPTAAADWFSKYYERPGIPNLANREASAVSSYAAGYAKGGKVPGGNKPPKGEPEWMTKNAKELMAEVAADQKAVSHWAGKMAYDAQHGLSAEYFLDSGKFKSATKTLASGKWELNRHKAYEAMTPVERAKSVENNDYANLQATTRKANIDYNAVEAIGAAIAQMNKVPVGKRDKTWAKDYGIDEAKYKKALSAYMSEGELEALWQKRYNNEAKKVASMGGGPGGPSLQLAHPNNQVDKLVAKVTRDPLLSRLIGSGSTSPLGWAMQPALGNLMIADVFKPGEWLGKPSSNAEYAAERANYYSAQDAVRQYMNSPANGGSMALAGKATGIHGTDAQHRKFAQGGYINEHVVGTGMSSGATYEFGEGGRRERVLTDAQTQQSGGSDSTQMLAAILCELKKGNGLATQAPQAMGRVVNGIGARRIPR